MLNSFLQVRGVSEEQIKNLYKDNTYHHLPIMITKDFTLYNITTRSHELIRLAYGLSWDDELLLANWFGKWEFGRLELQDHHKQSIGTFQQTLGIQENEMKSYIEVVEQKIKDFLKKLRESS